MANGTGDEQGSARDPRARAFVDARRRASALTSYPGAPPESLEEAYRIQDDAIALWPDQLVGWKVGRITGDWEKKLGCDRLAGPIFAERLVHATGQREQLPAFKGGFAAVEAECIIVLAKDAPASKLDWTLEEAIDMISSVRLGVEIASSPFAGINDGGPLVTISDFGNNFGLLVGEELAGWRDFPLSSWRMSTLIDDTVVGDATPEGIPGGPLESLRFLLENTARRGRPLKKGCLVSSGAVTGVHEATIGQLSSVRSDGHADLTLELVAARPAE